MFEKVKNAAARVKSALKSAVGAVKRAATAVVAKVKPTAKKTWAKVATAWRETIRPFVKVFGLVYVGIVWCAMVAVAPLLVLPATALVGLAALATARGLESADELAATGSRFGKFVVTLSEAMAHFLRGMFYGFFSMLALLTAHIWGPIVLTVIVIRAILRAMPASPNPYATPDTDSVVEDLETPAMYRRQKIEVIQPDARPSSPQHAAELGLVGTERPKVARPLGLEEMDMYACDACGTIAGELRARSHYVWNGERSKDMLCSGCYDLECEDFAVRYTGVSLKARGVEFRLNAAGLAATPQCGASLLTDSVHWAESAWWRDREGIEHVREWAAFVGGVVVANVIFDFRRRTLRLLVNGKPPRNVGAQPVRKGRFETDVRAAQALATELWNDAELAKAPVDAIPEPAREGSVLHAVD